jgi:hypothetical protein
MDRYDDVADWRAPVDGQTNTDRKLPFEDRKRLILATLDQIGRWRVHDLIDGDAIRCLSCELGLDESWIARPVRLDVKTLWQAHLERQADYAHMHAGAFDDGRHLGPRPGQLRVPTSGRQGEQRESEDEKTTDAHGMSGWV